MSSGSSTPAAAPSLPGRGRPLPVKIRPFPRSPFAVRLARHTIFVGLIERTHSMGYGRLRTTVPTVLLAGCFFFAPPASGQSAGSPAIVRGKVLDLKTREAIDKAVVSIRYQVVEATTGRDGSFELRNVEPGSVELYVAT